MLILADPGIPTIERVEEGVEDPIPMFPFWLTENNATPVDEATINGLTPAEPITDSVAIGVPVPTPRRVLVLSKKRLALFCDIRPLAPMNGTDPAVRPDR
jgi:hypothetical protein